KDSIVPNSDDHRGLHKVLKAIYRSKKYMDHAQSFLLNADSQMLLTDETSILNR
ncbi:hypothetical protein LOAG_13663, partial [Loa loa]